MCEPFAKPCLGGEGIVVVDWMSIAGEAREESELLISNSAWLAGKRLSNRQIIGEELRLCLTAHVPVPLLPRTTTGSSLRPRSFEGKGPAGPYSRPVASHEGGPPAGGIFPSPKIGDGGGLTVLSGPFSNFAAAKSAASRFLWREAEISGSLEGEGRFSR